METKRRHTILINKTFQFRIILKFILLNILIMILFGIFLYIFLNSEIESNLQSAHVTYKNIKDMLFPIIITLSILNILISSIIISIFVLYAMHKIAGPIYRFNEALKELTNKNLDVTTSVRDDDQLYECSNTLRNVFRVLSEDISGIKTKVKYIKNLSKKGSQNSELTEKIDEIENIVNKYKT
jgi:methyl-accepting chemotaxis protein